MYLAKLKMVIIKTLKVIDIIVEEKTNRRISAGAGVGTNGGSFAINVSENNWLGKGNSLDFELKLTKKVITWKYKLR